MARGGVPLTEETLPAVWVGEEDAERAREIVQEFESRKREEISDEDTAEQENWTCPTCGEIIEGKFSHCWKCQTGQTED